MNIFNLIFTIAIVIVSIVAIIVVMMQEGKSAGLTSSITGSGETYWGKNKGRSKEGAIDTVTKVLAVLFIVIGILVNFGFCA